ncbi:MAG: hypothetical protein A2Y21_07065 [Clostridiales bacterium GWC2_40_7]|nr:MAG: hypothetical protein A2Y21_07065 [Clostridiales bacterium GWC2_40_7]
MGRPNGLNEGPEVIQRNGKIFVIYSASGSWTADYCLGQLTCTNGNVLNAASWTKKSTPVFSKSGNVYDPGHHCFVKSLDGTQDWIVYHSSIDSGGSWNRCISMKSFTFNGDDSPNLGTPTQWGTSVAVPAGEPMNTAGGSFTETFAGNNDRWQEINHYRGASISIINGEYDVNANSDDRYQDKALIRNYDYTNFTLESDVKVLTDANGTTGAGLIFRAQQSAVGVDRYRGYYAGIRPGTDDVVLGYSNGTVWTQLGTASCGTINLDTYYHMKIVANGTNMSVYVTDMTTPKITVSNSQYTVGLVGVRGNDCHARFDNFKATVN